MFSKQEQRRTFPVYDASIEVSQVHNNCILNTLIPNIATGAHTITRSLPFKRAKRNKKNRNCSYKNMLRDIPIECFGN